MAGTLYLVATPIGNLEDLTYRAVRTLGEVDFVAAEDTRVSGKLLHYLEISKPLVSYHEHNKKQRGPELVERILAGENCALVTDAGMPAISDPGEDLANLCHEAGISVIPVPGACAAVSAVCRPENGALRAFCRQTASREKSALLCSSRRRARVLYTKRRIDCARRCRSLRSSWESGA